MKRLSLIHYLLPCFVVLLVCSTLSVAANEKTNISLCPQNADPATRQEQDRMVWDKDSVYVKRCRESHTINTSRWHRVAKFKSAYTDYDKQYWTDDSCLYYFDPYFDGYLKWIDFLREPFEILPNSIIRNGNNLISNSSIVLQIDTLISYKRVGGDALLVNDEYVISTSGDFSPMEYEAWKKYNSALEAYRARRSTFSLKCLLFFLVLWVILIWRNRWKRFSWKYSILVPLCYLPALFGIYLCLYELYYDPSGAELGVLFCYPGIAICIALLFGTRRLIHHSSHHERQI